MLVPPTFAHTDAAFHCVGKTAFIIRILEICLPLRRIVPFAVTQIFVASIRLDDFARIHFPIGIPDFLKLTESLHQFVAKHFR